MTEKEPGFANVHIPLHEGLCLAWSDRAFNGRLNAVITRLMKTIGCLFDQRSNGSGIGDVDGRAVDGVEAGLASLSPDRSATVVYRAGAVIAVDGEPGEPDAALADRLGPKGVTYTPRLEEAVRLPGQRHFDPSSLGAERLEANFTRDALAGFGAPRDDAIGLLPCDLRSPLMLLATDFGGPAEVRVVDLTDRLDVLHELRELFELRPLVVGRGHRDLDVNVFSHFSHFTTPFGRS